MKKRQSTKQTPVNSDTAALFASLPAALRRKQFSKEEQILLANERHTVILDAADELYHKHCRYTSAANPHFASTSRPSTSYFSTFGDRYSFLLDPDDDDEEEEEEGIAYLDTDMALTDFEPESFKWLEEEPKLDLRLDDYHAQLAETAQRQSETPARRSFARNLSLSNMSLRRRSSVSSQHQTSRTLKQHTTPSLHFNPATPSPSSPTFHKPKASVSSIDPGAQHYQDPAARMKLRVYLASASKFDEALEFGFPSMQNKQHQSSSRPRTSPRLTNESGRTFFTDDTPSLSGDDGSSHAELETLQDPRTPDDPEFREHRKSYKSSHERSSFRTHVVRAAPEPYAQGTTLDREMTIHMTLTRPDLRSPQDAHLTTKRINARPIEQPALPPVNEISSIWDTLPDDESKVKRLWKKLTLR